MSDDKDNLERELKLVPADEALLDLLEQVDRLGPFQVKGKRRERQRNSFFDTPSHALGAAHVGFRRRVIDGQPLATWSLKADAALVKGLATRSEIELQLDPDTSPALALGALRDAARTRGAQPLAETIGDALASGGLPLPQPYVETETDRRILDLESLDHSSSVELALDRMRVVGREYNDLEIEAELKRGNEAALDDVRAAIESLGEVTESKSSKLQRALSHLRQ